jgi:filamentous hemagglutinin
MNKRAFRLVFDRRRGMRVATAETVSSSGKSAAGEQRAARRSSAHLLGAGGAVAALALSVGWPNDVQAQLRTPSVAGSRVLSAAAVRSVGVARNALPSRDGLTQAQRDADLGNFNVATSSDGLQVNQFDDKVIINWSSFNLGQDMTVRFVQPGSTSAAFNQIWDANPSMVMGRIQANGEVILQNRNGFIFGPNARVDTGSFVATALQLTRENFLKGWRNITSASQGAAFENAEPGFEATPEELARDEALRQASVVLQEGAQIKTAAGGDVVLVAPQVYNAGNVQVNRGTATLAAGRKVYMYNSQDAQQRGLIVATEAYAARKGDLAGTVENINRVHAEQGRVNLVGLSVRQNGVASATTAVKGLNGQIYLQAMSSLKEAVPKDPVSDLLLVGKETIQVADGLGTVELGQGSETVITPVDDRNVTQKDSDAFHRSKIEVSGRDVTVGAKARVEAISGVVNIRAAESTSANVFSQRGGASVADSSRLAVGEGAIISARGLRDVSISASRHQLKAELFAYELSDAPVQRGGTLYRQKILFDARTNIGIANVSGFYNLIERDATELSTRGGYVNLLSQGDLVVSDQATLDVSGGSLRYEAGQVLSSLVRRGQTLVSIDQAEVDLAYDQLYSPTERVNAASERSAVQGADAGRLYLGASRSAIGRVQFKGDVVVGAAQRTGPNDAKGTAMAGEAKTGEYNVSVVLGRSDLLATQPALYFSLQPKAGQLQLGLSDPSGSQVRPLGSVHLLAGAQNPSVPTGDAPTSEGLNLAMASFGQNNFGSLWALGTTVSVASGASFLGGAHGSVQLFSKSDLAFDGKIMAAGANVALGSTAGSVTLGQGALIDVSGDVLDTTRNATLSTLTADGGSVSIKALGSVAMAAGSLIDVSAGALRATSSSTIKGKAGKVSLTVNDGAQIGNGLDPSVGMALNGQLLGFGFDKGGTLSLSGMRALSLGDKASAQPGTLTLAPTFFEQGGFTSHELTAHGDLDVQADTTVRPQVSSLVLLPATRSAKPGDMPLALKLLPDWQRAGVSLTLTTLQQPLQTLADALQRQQGQLTLGLGSVLDVGAGGSLSLVSGQSITLQGALVAHGGAVTLALSGKRGNETYGNLSLDEAGYIKTQGIFLKGSGVIDVSGVALTQALAGGDAKPQVVGKVLGGGSVTVNAVPESAKTAARGQFVAEAGSAIDLSGATGTITTTGRTRQDVHISKGAGALSVNGPDGWLLAGQIKADRPDASVSGGSFNGTLSAAPVRGDIILTTEVAAGDSYPQDNPGEVRLLASQSEAQAAVPTFGVGLVSAELLNNAGFDRISLSADRAIALGAGANLVANTTTEATKGHAAYRSVELFAPALRAMDAEQAPGTAKHLVRASRVALGNEGVGRPAADPKRFESANAIMGNAELAVHAGLVEVWGNLAFQGFGRPATGGKDALPAAPVSLLATLGADASDPLATRRDGEIRFLGRAPLLNTDPLKGQVNFAGELVLQAGQIYATSLSSITLSGLTGTSHLVTLAPEGGSTSVSPLSALGAFSASATVIDHGGVIRQPFGTIVLDASEPLPKDSSEPSLSLKPGSELSVAGGALPVPLGSMLNGETWLYNYLGQDYKTGSVLNGVQAVSKLGSDALNKSILVKGSQLSLSAQAVLDAQRGGDVIASEFISGVGGTTNTLLRPGVYAVVPNYTYDFAPHDTEIVAKAKAASAWPMAGEKIEVLTDNGVLPKGSYTLLPAGYAILPGAVLVSQTTLKNATAPIVRALQPSDDGSIVVSGRLTTPGSAGADVSLNPQSAWVIEPNATFNAKSTLAVTSINQLKADQARRDGTSLGAVPSDAGRVSLSSSQRFNWQADLRVAGGELDLAMGSLSLVDVVSLAEGAPLGQVSATDLNKSGARSVLLGGYRTLVDSVTEVTSVATDVRLQANLAVGEIVAAAKGTVSVADGVSLTALGATTGTETLLFKGAGAALVVSQNIDLDVRRTLGSLEAAAGSLSVGRDVALAGQAVSLDGSSALALDPSAKVQAASVDVSTGRIVLSDGNEPDKRAATLTVGSDLLTRFNQAQRLSLRAVNGIEMAASVALGRADQPFERLVLDAPLIQGTGTANDVVNVQARQVSLRNTSGKVLSEADRPLAESSLVINAQPASAVNASTGIELGAGAQHLAFGAANLNTTQDLVFTGVGTHTAGGDVTLQARRVTASTGTDQTLSTTGTLAISQVGQAVAVDQVRGLGARLNLQGKRLVQGGRIDLASGQLNLVATGQGLGSVASPTTVTAQREAASLIFDTASTTDVSGRTLQAGPGWQSSTQGGNISARALNGDVLVDGLLNVSAGTMAPQSDAAKSAGKLSLLATAGNVVLEKGASLRGQASTATLSGQLQVDTKGVRRGVNNPGPAGVGTEGTLDRLAQLAQQGGMRGEFNARLREGDQSLNTQLEAVRTLIAADQGKLDIRSGATILASAPQGGLVQLASKGDLTLDGSTIDARSTREGANGGDVMLSASGGVVHAEGVKLLDASGDDELDGRVLMFSDLAKLQALLDAAPTSAGSQSASAVSKTTNNIRAGEVAVVANQVYKANTIDAAADAISGLVRTDLVDRTKSTTTTTTTITGTGANRKTVITQRTVTTPSQFKQTYRWNADLKDYEVVATSSVTTGKVVNGPTVQVESRAFKATDKAGSVVTNNTQDVVTQGVPENTLALAEAVGRANAVTSRGAELGAILGLGSEVKVRAGVEVQSVGAPMSLSKAVALNDWRSGGQPLFLTLRSEQGLSLNSELSDGFATLGRSDTSKAAASPTSLVAGDAASFRLVAGADLTAANTLSTLDGAQFDLVLGPLALLRTTSGSIEMAAAQDVVIQSNYGQAGITATTSSQGVVYVAGRPLERLDQTSTDASGNPVSSVVQASAYSSKWAKMADHGGRLSLSAGRDILAPGAQQTSANWFDHVAETELDLDTSVLVVKAAGWWPTLDAVQQGAGTFGGNNLTISAGRDVRNLSMWAPTALDLYKETTTDLSTMQAIEQKFSRVLGGGDVMVQAGRDVLGGQLFAGRGQALVKVGRDIAEGTALDGSTLGTRLTVAQMDAAVFLESSRDLTFGAAFTPTLESVAKRLGTATAGSFSSYSDNASLSLSSTSGNVSWNLEYWLKNHQALRTKHAAVNDQVITTGSLSFASMPDQMNLLAPVLRVAAHTGNVSFGRVSLSVSPLVLQGAAQGDLSILAGGDLKLEGMTLMGGYQLGALPTLDTPMSYLASANTKTAIQNVLAAVGKAYSQSVSTAAIASTFEDDLHASDKVPVRLHAGGSVSGTDQSASAMANIIATKPLELSAGLDINAANLAVVAQNFKEGDVSSVQAGRNFTGAGSANDKQSMKLFGPGEMRVEAGRQLNLGLGGGVQAVGNVFNNSLPASGATLTVKAGALPGVKVVEFEQNFLASADSQSRFAGLVAQALPEAGVSSFDQAQAAWRLATPEQQLQLARSYLNQLFYDTYVAPGKPYASQWATMAQQAGVALTDLGSNAYQRLHDAVAYAEAARMGGQALAIADSTNPAENARRKAQRDAIWVQAEQMLDLAGLRAGFDTVGDLNVSGSAIANFTAGDFNVGGIHLMSPGGKQVLGLPGSGGGKNANGLTSNNGGSILSISGDDFLVATQKAFVVGTGDLMVYDVNGSIDSGKGSNTSVTPYAPQLTRLADGTVVPKLSNGTTGSGIGILNNDLGVAQGDVKLYAPRGEIRALDTYIRNQGTGSILVVGDVKGGGNIKGSVVGLAVAPTLGFAPSPTTGLKDEPAAGALKDLATSQADGKSKSSLVTVDVLALGDDAAPTAAGPAATGTAGTAGASDKACSDGSPSCKKAKP